MVIEQPIKPAPAKGFFLKKGFKIYILLVILLVVFSAGLWAGRQETRVTVISPGAASYGTVENKNEAIPEFLSKDVQFKIFWDVWSKLQDKYVDGPIGETKLFYGALSGMVAGLGDPYSTFFEPKSADNFTQELSGKFEGIGAEIAIRNDVLTVVSPLIESPAEKAGLRAGDVILEIDGFNTKNIDVNDAVNRIRGDKGTSVKLKIYRPKPENIFEVSIVRDTIKIISVKLEEFTKENYPDLGDKKINMITVTNFNSDTAERFRQAAEQVLLNNPDGLILDLRSNPGGYLDTAVNMANYWLAKGDVVVVEEFRDKGQNKSHLASANPVFDKFKTVILVNGGSASGSEIVAGALQDLGKAILIGEKTFGKGSVQELENLSDGSAVKITIAKWLTPKGRRIDQEGIKPDIEIERTADDLNNFKDPQLDRAIEYFVEGK